ncbi:uncharacterized protein G2W53_017696 [Senna tora]|uniref:Uncharacterized protein n=1 Tax=Senna tora TaxID=362788 RepID=A0A834TRC5_9FABA|nr:uncharacterized protein G2W53_017696 [Senna tora]
MHNIRRTTMITIRRENDEVKGFEDFVSNSESSSGSSPSHGASNHHQMLPQDLNDQVPIDAMEIDIPVSIPSNPVLSEPIQSVLNDINSLPNVHFSKQVAQLELMEIHSEPSQVLYDFIVLNPSIEVNVTVPVLYDGINMGQDSLFCHEDPTNIEESVQVTLTFSSSFASTSIVDLGYSNPLWNSKAMVFSDLDQKTAGWTNVAYFNQQQGQVEEQEFSTDSDLVL